jgi:succinate dehydrogenase / fumarate reductase cytochrome b subunit
MSWFSQTLTSSIGKKLLMALTGLFLISFLVIHATINAMIFYNDGGETFTHWGHFMGTNPIIRTLEIGLVAGFLIHIVDGLLLWKNNKEAGLSTIRSIIRLPTVPGIHVVWACWAHYC